jgi:hypothetical protein
VASNDLSPADQERFLRSINDLCGDTYCEGPFEYEFFQIECRFSASVCGVAFNMVTDDPTRANLSPTRITSASHDSKRRLVAALTAVVPPSKCDRGEAGLEPLGPPCTIVTAVCFLTPIKSVVDYERGHWDLLSDCVGVLEQSILIDSGT